MVHAFRSFPKFFLITLTGLCLAGLVGTPAQALEKKISNSLGMEFLLIPPGTFVMGSPQTEANRQPDEVPHSVTFTQPFYLQSTEVTVDQWKALMGEGWLRGPKGPGTTPVTNISWHDCMAFLKRLNEKKEGVYRLPTEAEWEYACRAGSTTAYAWGETIECSQAMFSNNTLKSKECLDYVRAKGLSVDDPAPVKSYAPNAWGIYDMHGNLWEWCQDWFGRYTFAYQVNPRGPLTGSFKIRRGGSWFKYDYFCRSANRNFGHPAARYQTTGFRVVMEPSTP